MNQPVIKYLLIVSLFTCGTISASAQTTIPEILTNGSITEQMKYIEEKTLIYENFRAIREDMFQMIKNNSLDSLTKTKSKIAGYVLLTGNLNFRIDSLTASLNAIKEESKELSETKNNIHVIGLDLNKNAYNSIMWTIIAGLFILLALGYLVFQRNRKITLSTRKELNELKTEFEEYRQKSRIEREKVSMDHFNEIRKLKGK